MRKIFSIILILLLALGLVACGGTSQNKGADGPSVIAEQIATLTDADLYEIKLAVEYTDADIDYGDTNNRTSKEQNDSSARPEIQSKPISLEGYDTIYKGYPIWWGEEPRIMDTFVESYDFGDITMIPFCTSGSSGIGNSGKNLEENAGSGSWLEGKRFSAQVSENELKDWVRQPVFVLLQRRLLQHKSNAPLKVLCFWHKQ